MFFSCSSKGAAAICFCSDSIVSELALGDSLGDKMVVIAPGITFQFKAKRKRKGAWSQPCLSPLTKKKSFPTFPRKVISVSKMKLDHMDLPGKSHIWLCSFSMRGGQREGVEMTF